MNYYKFNESTVYLINSFIYGVPCGILWTNTAACSYHFSFLLCIIACHLGTECARASYHIMTVPTGPHQELNSRLNSVPWN